MHTAIRFYAGMMELADMRDLGSRAQALGFKSPCPHQNVLMKDATPKTPHESAVFSHIMRNF